MPRTSGRCRTPVERDVVELCAVGVQLRHADHRDPPVGTVQAVEVERQHYNVTLVLFFVGCAGAAAAWNIWALIGFRAVQGLGGAVFPLSFAIIRDEFPREKVGVAIGLISAVFGVGGGLGIVLAGVIVDNLSWRWLFVVGAIPVGLSAVLVSRFVPESPIKSPSRIDVPGALSLSAGLIALLLA